MVETEGKIVIPIGLARTIAENPDAMRVFGEMSAAEQGMFIKKAKGVKTPEEMKAIASDIAVFR